MIEPAFIIHNLLACQRKNSCLCCFTQSPHFIARLHRTVTVFHRIPCPKPPHHRPITPLVSLADVRELISVDDAMEDSELRFGPNGGLIFCMEYLAQNMDWLHEQLEEVEDDYILFDCPGALPRFFQF